jgi:hypothetical protein
VYAAIQLRAAAAAAASATAIGTETAAITAQGVAATTAGGALMAFAKRAAIGMAAAYAIDGIAGKFGVGKDKADQSQDDANWNAATPWEKVQSGLPRGIEHVGRFIGLGNIADQAQADRVKSETEYLRKNGRLPEAPGMRGTAPAAPNVTQNITNNITQQPGEDSAAFARRLMKEFQKQQGVQQRGALTDGATAN